MEGKGGRQPLTSSGRAGDRVLGLQGKEDGAGGRSGRGRVKVTMRVRQLRVFVFGAAQTQVTGQSLNAKGSDSRMEVKNWIFTGLWDVLPLFCA